MTLSLLSTRGSGLGVLASVDSPLKGLIILVSKIGTDVKVLLFLEWSFVGGRGFFFS